MSTKTAVYVRVSTLDQESGIQSQEKALREYLNGHGIKDALWFRDRLSAKDTKRPALKQLQKAIFNGQVKTVICWKLDRLSRSIRDGVNLLTDWVSKDVRIVSVTQQLDFSGAMGSFVATLLFALAQMERENLRENTKRGMALARANGKQIGARQKVSTFKIVNRLKKGMSIAQISRKLKLSRQTIYNCLERDGISLTKI